MNIPKAIRSLKSKCLISTTPILCRIEASHPATRLFRNHIIAYCCQPILGRPEDFQNLLRPAARYAILRIEKGKAREAATLKSKNLIYIRPSLLAVVAAIVFFP